VLAAGRFFQGVEASLRSRHSLQMSLPEVGVHCCLLACLTPAYFLGLCREIALSWEQIRRRFREDCQKLPLCRKCPRAFEGGSMGEERDVEVHFFDTGE
jgi:hypothetical protein